jgi:hypothetical protein
VPSEQHGPAGAVTGTVASDSRRRCLPRRALVYFGLDGDDPFRALAKPERRRVGLAMLLGRPAEIPENLIPSAVGHARRYRWWSWMGCVYSALGAAAVGVRGFAVGGKPLWFLGIGFLVVGGFWLLGGRNVRRVARLGDRDSQGTGAAAQGTAVDDVRRS